MPHPPTRPAPVTAPLHPAAVRCLLIVLAGVAAARGEDIAPGVTFTRHDLPAPNVVHVLAIDRDHPEYRLMVGWPEGKRNFATREGTSVIAGHYDEPGRREVLGGVNASFFGPAPRINGVTGSDGELQEQPDGVRDTLLLTAGMLPRMIEDVEFLGGTLRLQGGRTIPVDQFNAPVGDALVTVYTRSWRRVDLPEEGFSAIVLEHVSYPLRSGKEVRGLVAGVTGGGEAAGVEVPEDGLVVVLRDDAAASAIHPGEEVYLRLDTSHAAMNNADMCVTGVGWLLRGGKPKKRNWRQYGFADVRHPRTVVAWNRRQIFLMVVDGRSRESVGMTFGEMATFLQEELKATDAVNLDGGGSSTMLVRGVIRNVPSDGRERAVANAVLLVREPATTTLPFEDRFEPAGRAASWDDKFTYNGVSAFEPISPGGDGYVMTVLDPAGGVETVRNGRRGDGDYAVEADVYCEYRPDVAAHGFERYGLFARDDGSGGFGLQTFGGGNCYALTYDSHDGRIRAGVIRRGVFRDFLEERPIFAPATAWRRMRIECRGPVIRYVVDGQVVCEQRDRAHRRGFFGVAYQDFFIVNGHMRGTRADNLRVTAP